MSKPCTFGGTEHNVLKFDDGVICCADCGKTPDEIQRDAERRVAERLRIDRLDRQARRQYERGSIAKDLLLATLGITIIASVAAFEFRQGVKQGDSIARTEYAEKLNRCYDEFDREGIFPDDAKAGDLYTCVADWKDF